MPISAGTRFGPYAIAEPIGSGGMGEVYRARDTTLDREVAIKVLPALFTDDANRIARFEREAKTLAALNHPNIAHIYGLERSDGTTALVMELIEGPTLAERIAQGRVPVDEALRIAMQIADALEAAHERGIVHRDLKPANIKIAPDGTAKVLDFGIAKAVDARGATGPGPAALTTPAMTEAGIVLGTAAYMSPEQARGKFVDQRTDIWAFGCVLYEMLTGRPAFLGEDVTSTLARVLEAGADLDALPGGVPASVRRTLELCLEKNARKRIADVRDVKLALAGAFSVEAPAQQRRSRSLPMAAAVVAAALLAGAAVWVLRSPGAPEPKVVTRFEYRLPAGVDLRVPSTSVLSIAPNGEFFAVNGTGGIHVRRLRDFEARVVAGTADERSGAVPEVAVSPDGRDVAHLRGPPGKLMRVSIERGSAVAVADVPPIIPFGLSWERDGTMLYGEPDGIWRVSENGGTPKQVIETRPPEQVYGPRLLPGGEWMLFTLTSASGPGRWNEADIVIQSLKSGERRILRSGGFDARYLPTGHMTYVSGNTLFGATFDLSTLKLGDERVALIQGLRTADPPVGGAGFYAVADNGTLVYIPETSARAAKPERPRRSLVWVDRAGKTTPLPVPPDDYTMARISPDGTKIALVVGSAFPQTDPLPDIYVFDLPTGNLSQVTFDPLSDDGPVWSRDGSRIFYRSRINDPRAATISSVSVVGGEPAPVVRAEGSGRQLPWSISPDGNTLLLVDGISFEDVNLATVGLQPGDRIKPLLDTNDIVTEPSLSRDGQWMVYAEGPDSDTRIGIRPYPDVRQRRQPIGSGRNPVFSPDGSEILFFDGNGFTAAPV
jgi:eukaryotic-like serine/threonine-protein kinase